MIRIVEEAMRLHCPNPSLAACTEVARMIVGQFPTTFADKTADDEQLGRGYYSILKQLKTRVEYVNRYLFASRTRQLRKRGRPRSDQAPEARQVHHRSLRLHRLAAHRAPTGRNRRVPGGQAPEHGALGPWTRRRWPHT